MNIRNDITLFVDSLIDLCDLAAAEIKRSRSVAAAGPVVHGEMVVRGISPTEDRIRVVLKTTLSNPTQFDWRQS